MAKQKLPQVITANLLIEGSPVWRTADGGWSTNFRDAEVLSEPDLATQRLAQAEGEAHLIVGPYLADTEMTDAGPAPAHFREKFRVTGPTVLTGQTQR